MAKAKSVAIVGAGPSGLVCAKVFLDDGFDVTVFDEQRELGGTWSAEKAYADLHTQQPGGTYEFSDLFDGEEFAPWQKVHDYLQKYANLFHITERIRFQTRVVSIDKDDLKNDAIPWMITVKTADGENETLEFDFVVVATGVYSKPFVPTFPGQHKFTGSIVYPSMIKSYDQLANKRVVVIGTGKCATDMAILSGRFARSCHLVFRKAHWITPRTIMGGRLPVRYLHTRVSNIPYIPFPGAPHTDLFHYFHQRFPNFAVKMSDNISADLLATHGPDLYEDKIFIPQYTFRHEDSLSTITSDFARLKKQGRIVGKLASIEEIIDGTTVRLDSGEELQADMIICATGFIKQFPFFSEKHAQMMSLETMSNGDTQTNLYRQILPIGIPNIGFIGFTISVAYCLIAEVSSHWLSEYFLKRLKLPSEEQMKAEITRRHQFLDQMFRTQKYQPVYYWIGLLDTLLQDMGLALHRTSNWITEYFGIYRPNRLKGLHEERQIKAETGVVPHRWYFGFENTVCLILIFIALFVVF